jgi:hypothetical protein
MNRKLLDEYFDDQGHQVKRLPDAWMLSGRFAAGQKLVVFDLTYHVAAKPFGDGGRNVEAEVVEAHDGYGSWPPRMAYWDGEEIEDNQHEGWLVARVPFVVSRCWDGKRQSYVDKYTIALGLSGEGIDWKLKDGVAG